MIKEKGRVHGPFQHRMSTCTIYKALSSIYSHFGWSAHYVPFLPFLPNISQASDIGPWFLYRDPKECNLSKVRYRPGYPTATQRHWSITWRSQSGSPRSTEVPFNDTMLDDLLNTFFPYSTFSPFLWHKLGIHTFETSKAKPTSVTYILSSI